MIHLSTLSNIIIIILPFHYFILQISCQQLNARIVPGCSLINDSIYCYGGFAGSANNNGIEFTGELNENNQLDLTVFDDFSTFDKTKIKWITKSKVINGTTTLPSVGQVATTNASDGSIFFYGGRGAIPTSMPFLHYNPQTDIWNNISVPNNTYFVRNQILDIGNNRIWIFGGFTDTEVRQQNYFYIYDYKNNLWPVIQPMRPDEVSLDFSTSLVNNIIYIIGGAQPVPPNKLMLNTFNDFKTYNTIDGTWKNLTVNGDQVAERGHHTSVATMDKKYLLIYGGSQATYNEFHIAQDVYYVYDIENNNIKSVSIPPSAQIANASRFGHYASIYKTNYMLLVFGFRDMTTPAENLNVLNIKDPFQPQWVDVPNNQPQSYLKTIIPAIVIPFFFVLLGSAIGIYFYMKHRKLKKKEAFQFEELEKEDPRKLVYPQRTDDLTIDGTTVIRSEGSEYQNTNNNNDDYLAVRPSLNDNTDDKNILYGKLDLPHVDIDEEKKLYGKLDLSENDIGKPFEKILSIKPSEPS